MRAIRQTPSKRPENCSTIHASFWSSIPTAIATTGNLQHYHYFSNAYKIVMEWLIVVFLALCLYIWSHCHMVSGGGHRKTRKIRRAESRKFWVGEAIKSDTFRLWPANFHGTFQHFRMNRVIRNALEELELSCEVHITNRRDGCLSS